MSQVVIGDILPYTQATAILNQVVFGTNWTANIASDVVVYVTPPGDDADDVTQMLAYPAGYSVSFIGSQQDVQVTLVTPSVAGAIVTITRQTPADRMNLYTNTNFTPSMLNNDFGILTLVDQQAQLVDQKVGPRYNYSAIIVDVVDTILPILGANETWVKNPSNTFFIPYELPSSGIAPADETYVTITDETSDLPNSVNFAGLSAGIVSFTGSGFVSNPIAGTTHQINIANATGVSGSVTISISDNAIIPGTAGMGIPEGTTAQRVIPSSNIGFRYNTTNQELEYWTGINWAGLTDNGLTHNYIFVGDSTGTADAVPMSGDTTIIDTGAVTVSKIGGVGISLSGAFTTHGAFTTDFTFTGNTAVTFPQSGTLATTTGSVATLTGDSGTATASAGNINVLGGSTGLIFTGASATLTLGGLLNSTFGGTGLSAPTAHGIMIGEGASPMTPIVLSSGQILIGSTGSDPVAAAINSGTSVLVANGAGSITVGLAPITSHNILSNITGGSAAPISNTLTATIDAAIGSTQGNILYRNASGWVVLAPGTNGQFLTTGGAAANVSWSSQVAPTGAALTEVNDTNVTMTLGGSPTVALLAATSMTLGWTGTLSNARGGTGTGTYTLGDTLYASAANTLSKLTGNITVVKQYLSQTGDGVNSAAPIWATIAGSDITGATLSKTDDTNVTMTLGGTPTTALLRAASIALGWTGQLSIARGGTSVASVTTSPTATAFAGWDANLNLSANSFIDGFATTATAASTTVLTVASKKIQEFTGVTTQTVTLPVTSTLVAGQQYLIINNSSGNVTVNSSGGNAVQVMASGTSLYLTCVLNSGTTAASWNGAYFFENGANVQSITGTANQVIASSSTGAITLSLPQSIATTSDVTFGSVTFSPTTKGIVGTPTNNDAATSYVGEVVTASVASGSAVSMTSPTYKTITSISLTAGDWDVRGFMGTVVGAGTVISAIAVGISLTNNAQAGELDNNISYNPLIANNVPTIISPVTRISIASTTTVYLVGVIVFSVSTASAFGKIVARRVR